VPPREAWHTSNAESKQLVNSRVARYNAIGVAILTKVVINKIESGSMSTASIKTEAQRLVEKLPNDATWDDLMYEIYVRQAVEAGLKDSEAARTMDVKDVRAHFGLPE
jgi:hypothetical protein